ncbi:MAG: thiamine pyrophosphate-dependent enzyme [Candidatus Eremiobacteraeota bacterium]|nr:thiamine pyrophosphate-dependent enzyme [Candidatus Eremiobacteraeota bacterium]
MDIKPYTDKPIKCIEFDGRPATDLKALAISTDRYLEMYRWLVFTRAVDDRGYILVRQGRAGFYAQTAGQEASQVGSAMPLLPQDWMYGDHRSQGSQLVKGLSTAEWFAHILGKSLDPTAGRSMPGHVGRNSLHIVPPSSTVGNQITEAVGTAMAQQIKKTDEVTICYFGDGATSEGDFHVGMNFAAVYGSPCILFCQNNQYAISVRLEEQTHTKTIAEKARAYGMDGYFVDGNDVLAVYAVTKHCVDRARRGEGPALIEAYTYRYGPHSSADDDTRYRPKGELEMWRTERDPVNRFRKFLELQKLWDGEKEAKLSADVKAELAAAMEEAEKSPVPQPLTVFDHVYEKLTPHLEWERRELADELGVPVQG